MNYLAHSFLSANEPGLVIGNFIADHLHGNKFDNLPEDVIEGIKLHRRIDAFTDSHILFQESKRIFYKGFEKYSGILVDIYFDHLLAANFDTYSRVPLQEHCDTIYKIYETHIALLPQSGKGFLKYVLNNNIYFAYSSQEGIETVLYHLSHRINHGIWLNQSIELFRENEEKLKENFDGFFRDAMRAFL